MRWNQGRSHVDRLIADGELQRVPANREHADQLIVQARKDLASAKLLLESNLKRAYRYPGAPSVDALRASMDATRNWRRSSGSGFSISRADSVIPSEPSSDTT